MSARTMDSVCLSYGARLVASSEDASLSTDRALPRSDARSLVSELRAIGVDASDAIDNDDRSIAWVYVTREAT